MGLWNTIRSAFAGPPSRPAPEASQTHRLYGAGVTINTSHELAEYLRQGVVSEQGVEIGATRALTIAAAYRCANLIADAMARARIEFREEATFDAVDQTDLHRLINRRPNGWQSGEEFKKQLTLHALFKGNGVAVKVRSGNRVSSLLPINAPVGIEQRKDGTIIYKITTDHGVYMEKDQSEVFHLRGFSLDGFKGVSVLTYAREILGLSHMVQQHGQALFKNGTRMAGILSHPNRLGAEALANIRESLSKYRGPEGADSYGVMVVEEGMSYSPITMTSADAEFVQNRQMSIIDVCIFFGVPPHMIGFTERQTSYGQGVQEQGRSFRNYGLSAYEAMWKGAVIRDLLPRTSTVEPTVNLDHLTAANELETWQANRIKLEMGVYTPNELRRKAGHPRIEGGDVLYDPPNVPQDTGTTEQETRDEGPTERQGA